MNASAMAESSAGLAMPCCGLGICERLHPWAGRLHFRLGHESVHENLLVIKTDTGAFSAFAATAQESVHYVLSQAHVQCSPSSLESSRFFLSRFSFISVASCSHLD